MANPMVNADGNARQKPIWRRLYRLISLSMSIIFAVVGLLFLFIPDSVVIFFNHLSGFFDLPEASVSGLSLYVVLAVGYMYLVTLLAYCMSRQPENHYFAWLLINGKSASSLISLFLFIFHWHYLILLTNGIVDGMIAIGVLILSRQMRESQA